MKVLLKTAFFVLIARLLIAAFMPLSADEAYYYLYTLNPSLSYFDHPPMVSLAGLLFSFPFASAGRFFLRLGPVLLFTAALLPFYLLAKSFLKKEDAAAASMVFLLVPIFFVSGALLLPDAPLLLFFSWGLYRFKKAADEPSDKNCLFFGIAAGLALLSKYTALFLFAGAFVYLLTDKNKRKLLSGRGPWIALAAAAVIFIPVVIWNINNSFASFSFQAARPEFRGIRADYLGQFTAGQLGYLLPFFFFPALYFAFKSVSRIKKDGFEKFIFCFGFIPLVFFLVYSLFFRTLSHWPVIAYITLCLPVGKFYAGLYRKKRRLFNFYSIAHIALIGILAPVAVLQMHFGVLYNRPTPLSAAARPERIRPDDISTAWMGWEDAVEAVEEIAYGGEFFLFCDRWFTAGYLAHACRGEYPVLVLSDLNAARGFAFWQKQQAQAGKDGFFIITSRFYSDRSRRYAPYFDGFEFIKSVPVERSGKIVKYIYIYRGRNFLAPYPVIPQG